jgi:hypothetical protein
MGSSIANRSPALLARTQTDLVETVSWMSANQLALTADDLEGETHRKSNDQFAASDVNGKFPPDCGRMQVQALTCESTNGNGAFGLSSSDPLSTASYELTELYGVGSIQTE